MPFFGGLNQYQIIGQNIRGGTDALPSPEGVDNYALGNGSQAANVSGSNNLSFGEDSLSSSENPQENISLGNRALTGGYVIGNDGWTINAENCVIVGMFSAYTGSILPPPPP